MSVKLTKKQKQIIDFISAFSKDQGFAPTYREIMSGLGLSSVSAVAEHVENLVEKGALKKTDGVARSLEVVDTTHPETVKLFNEKIVSSESEDEIELLLKAAEILGLDLESEL
ncbi:hypothetical protein IJH27_00570 [Candidatus Saccharibacteria bacterium]|nr:hypothetical protein [Candidatus Saccharibacteria bacterium]